jgi:hypothetical protein
VKNPFGMNVSALMSEPSYRDLLAWQRRAQPAVTVCINRGFREMDALREAAGESAIVINRQTSVNGQNDEQLWQNIEPARMAEWVRGSGHGRRDVYAYILNEPGADARISEWLADVIRILAPDGWRLCVGNLASGAIQPQDVMRGDWDALIHAACEHRDTVIIGVHEYTTGIIPAAINYDDGTFAPPDGWGGRVYTAEWNQPHANFEYMRDPANWLTRADIDRMERIARETNTPTPFWHLNRLISWFDMRAEQLGYAADELPYYAITEAVIDNMSDVNERTVSANGMSGAFRDVVEATVAPPEDNHRRYTEYRGHNTWIRAFEQWFAERGWSGERALFEQYRWAWDHVYHNRVLGSTLFQWTEQGLYDENPGVLDWGGVGFAVNVMAQFLDYAADYTRGEAPPEPEPPMNQPGDDDTVYDMQTFIFPLANRVHTLSTGEHIWADYRANGVIEQRKNEHVEAFVDHPRVILRTYDTSPGRVGGRATLYLTTQNGFVGEAGATWGHDWLPRTMRVGDTHATTAYTEFRYTDTGDTVPGRKYDGTYHFELAAVERNYIVPGSNISLAEVAILHGKDNAGSHFETWYFANDTRIGVRGLVGWKSNTTGQQSYITSYGGGKPAGKVRDVPSWLDDMPKPPVATFDSEQGGVDVPNLTSPDIQWERVRLDGGAVNVREQPAGAYRRTAEPGEVFDKARGVSVRAPLGGREYTWLGIRYEDADGLTAFGWIADLPNIRLVAIDDAEPPADSELARRVRELETTVAQHDTRLATLFDRYDALDIGQVLTPSQMETLGEALNKLTHAQTAYNVILRDAIDTVAAIFSIDTDEDAA